ncbi:DUF6415 family natural product biosynthesis protein [Streptomyces sp. NPDC002790]|uniref:DUF6415 family natural product biosynthesis protein n=1 Tax=Streptomyces sp. NPDC002790 TaxID=3154431 RepID=UPI00332892A7
MRHSLGLHRDGSQLVVGRACRADLAESPPRERDHVVAATETVTLVLGEESPLPESASDVEDLVRLLRGHVAQLATRAAPEEPALLRAQRLCADSIPEGYMPSRVYLVKLAEATQELAAHVRGGGCGPTVAKDVRRWRRPKVNVLRGVVFALALTCLVLAASVPRS